ncbi:hypothetical protein L810_6383 [Burkholderia sp. AU4i]|nr:hypothetical protein L810_6383 [Burkholderia sp. AU4i]
MNMCIEPLKPLEHRRPAQRERWHEPVHRGVIEGAQLLERTIKQRGLIVIQEIKRIFRTGTEEELNC